MWSCSKLSFRRFSGHRGRGGRRLRRKNAVLPAPHLTESGPSRRPAPAANPSRGPGLPRLTDIQGQGSWGLREDVHHHEGGGKEASEAAAGVHASPATSDAHARRSCDAGVAPATSSEHRTPACDPTVAANRRQRTQTTPLCSPADTPHRTRSTTSATRTRASPHTHARLCPTPAARLCPTAAKTRLRQRCSTAGKIQLSRPAASTVLGQQCRKANGVPPPATLQQAQTGTYPSPSSALHHQGGRCCELRSNPQRKLTRSTFGRAGTARRAGRGGTGPPGSGGIPLRT
jgi:hypothetical protein